MVSLFIDHEVCFLSAPPGCLFSLLTWLETLQKWWPAAGEGCQSFEVRAVYWSRAYSPKKIKEGIKGIAKLFKTLHAPKKGISDSVNKQSRWWLLVGTITPLTPVTPQTDCWVFYFKVGQQHGSQFDWHLSLIRGQVTVWRNLQMTRFSQHTVETWLQNIYHWNIRNIFLDCFCKHRSNLRYKLHYAYMLCSAFQLICLVKFGFCRKIYNL